MNKFSFRINRTFTIVILFIIIPIVGFTQNDSLKRIYDSITRPIALKDFIAFNPEANLNAVTFWQNYSTVLGLELYDNMVLSRVDTDQIGFKHYRFQQSYKGVKIEGAEYILHEYNGVLESGNGMLVKNLDKDINPVISESSALQVALNYIGATEYMWQDTAVENLIKRIKNDPNASYYPNGVLVLYSSLDSIIPDSFRLVYKFDIYASNPISRKYIFIDAVTGQIFDKIERIINSCTDAIGTAETRYNGPQTISTCFDNNNNLYYLHDNIRGGGIKTYSLINGTNYSNFTEITDDDNYWNQDLVANSAHWAAENTYDFFMTKFSRNSYDGNGSTLYNYVHFGVSFNNAFWDGDKMTFGDGINNNPLVTLDIVGHEISHGVTEYTANLTYARAGSFK